MHKIVLKNLCVRNKRDGLKTCWLTISAYNAGYTSVEQVCLLVQVSQLHVKTNWGTEVSKRSIGAVVYPVLSPPPPPFRVATESDKHSAWRQLLVAWRWARIIHCVRSAILRFYVYMADRRWWRLAACSQVYWIGRQRLNSAVVRPKKKQYLPVQ